MATTTADAPTAGAATPFARDSDARERAIPIRPADLVRALLADEGVSPVERGELAQLAKLLGATLHHEYQGWSEELKDLYAAYDPDTDCVDLDCSAKVSETGDEAFLKPFESALIRANYRPLRMQVIEDAVAAPNEKGLTYVPDFKIFEHLRVYVRGSTQIGRYTRNLKSRFRRRKVDFPGYQRFVVLLKFREGMDLDDFVRSDVIYIRMFKDVPHVDMEMHLPEQGTKVKMRLIDKAQIASPFVAFPASMAAKSLTFLIGAAQAGPSFTVGALMLAPITAAVNSFFGFKRAKQRHLSTMIRHLYYLTLCNNGGVINYVVNSAEEEDFKEALLAYHCLWRHRDDGETWDSARVDRCIEAYLRQQTSLPIDFDVSDALGKLYRFGIVHKDHMGHLSALPIGRALEILDQRWDDTFRFNRPRPSPADV